MTNKRNETLRKSRKSEVVNASAMEQVINVAAAVAAPAGASVGAAVGSDIIGLSVGGNGVGLNHENSGAPAGGAAVRGGVGRVSGADQLNNHIIRDDSDLALGAFRSKVAAHFAAPEWSGAAAVRAALAPLGLDDEQVNAAVAAAARKSGLDLSPRFCSIPRVLAVIRANYRNEFNRVCGCSFDACLNFFRNALSGGERVGTYAASLPASLIQPNSKESEFIRCQPLAPDASAYAVVGAVLSFRWVAEFRRGLAAACAAARSTASNNLDNAVRCGRLLGWSRSDFLALVAERWDAVNLLDDKQARKLSASLSRQLLALAAVDARLVVALPACSDIDTSGAFVVADGYTLPSVGVPARVRKLWVARTRLLSTIATLSGLLRLA
jgi:hypothetical protein